MAPLCLLVTAIRLEAADVLSVELRGIGNAPLPEFSAGAHIELHLHAGLRRAYSILSSPLERERYVIAVLLQRKGRGGSLYVHENMRVGMQIECGHPRNNFELEEAAESTVLVAGGIGITPILCMFDRLRAMGAQVSLIYCARSRAGAPFLRELAGHDSQVTLHFDDEAGRPPDLLQLLADRPSRTHFYCCGPSAMLAAFEVACEKLGYLNRHVERFSNPGDDAPALDKSYSVELARSGRTLEVHAGTSLLATLQGAGYDIESSCCEGYCGTCEVKVIEGIPDHRDSVLTQREKDANRKIMACVSGCKSERLVLDL